MEKGYHLRDIPRGTLGEFSKIEEEFLELKDACEQNAKLMVLIELSDLHGAIIHYLRKHFPTIHYDDLIKMNCITERAFRSGCRQSREDASTKEDNDPFSLVNQCD